MYKSVSHIKPLKGIITLIMMVFSFCVYGQMYVGDGLYINKNTTISTKQDVIINTNSIEGEGQIILNGEKQQKVEVKKNNTSISAQVVVNNEKGIKLKGADKLQTTQEIAVVKGSIEKEKSNFEKNIKPNISQSYLATIQVIRDKNAVLPVVYKEKSFKKEILGYAHVQKITQEIEKSSSTNSSNTYTSMATIAIEPNYDFIQLPQIIINYTKKSSDFYYTHTYKNDDYSQIFHPPKIS